MMWINAKIKLPDNNDDVIVITDVGDEKNAHYSIEKKAWFSNGFLVVPDVVFWKRKSV